MAKRLPTFLRASELDRLQAAAENPRDRLILSLGLLLGLRVSELVKLRIERIDLERSVVLVYAGKGDKDRYVPIPQKLRTQLTAWIGETREGWLLPSPRTGGPLTSRMVQRLIKRLAKLAGLAGAELPRKATPHKLRHGYATKLLETGATIREVQQLLGHASVATTEIYTHVLPERLKGAVDRL